MSTRKVQNLSSHRFAFIGSNKIISSWNEIIKGFIPVQKEYEDFKKISVDPITIKDLDNCIRFPYGQN
ncbi:5127_t:CDS:2 [Diversispora eburnea]|uniref:5127_t:CDS:1 n=1 Tax=Diversispora eburnea TaxID=1213867 RepID=A0A9N9G4X5_9GLOM|nr:5127_t:CDS:2 [Diversispora eburnea]